MNFMSNYEMRNIWLLERVSQSTNLLSIMASFMSIWKRNILNCCSVFCLISLNVCTEEISQISIHKNLLLRIKNPNVVKVWHFPEFVQLKCSVVSIFLMMNSITVALLLYSVLKEQSNFWLSNVRQSLPGRCNSWPCTSTLQCAEVGNSA